MKLFRDGRVTFEGSESVMRKYLETEDAHRRRVEQEIARRVQASPQPNVVEIYDVGDCVTQELLEPLDEYPRETTSVMEHVSSGLDQLHSIGVVYIDLHVGNVGWSPKSGRWKIFDFNMSGVVEKGSWKLEPSAGIAYNRLKSEPVRSLFDLDHHAIRRFHSELVARDMSADHREGGI